MGGGMFGSKSGQTSGSRALEGIATEMNNDVRPVRQELFSQMLEGLRTGGIGARIPLIESSVEQSRAATSSAMRQIDQSLAASGLAGTPFGERTRAESLMAGEAATGRIPSDIVSQMLSTLPGLTTGTGQVVVQGMGSAAGAQSNLASAQTMAFSQLMSSMFEAAGNAAGGAAS